MLMTGSLLCGYGAPQPRHDRRVVPLHRAEMPPDLAPMPVDQQARRQAGRIERERGLCRGIDVERQRLDTDLSVELARDGRALLVDRQRHHPEAFATELGLQAVE